MDAPEELPVAGTVVLLRATPTSFEVLMMRRPDRGSFSGAWVFPGGKVEEGDLRAGAAEVDDARRAGIRETREEVGLVVDGLLVLSQWQPPPEAPTRIRTWFFVAIAPPGELQLSAGEVAAAEWVAPGDALAQHGAGERTLFPPTWITLYNLSKFGDTASAIASAGVPRLFQTQTHRTESGQEFRWGSDRLETGALPWRFVEGVEGVEG